MPQYKVPQFIDLEDKIVGPFTMKQFIYLLVGGAIDYGLFNYFNQFENGLPYFIVIALPVTLLALALTFIKINDRPFEIFLLNLVFYIFIPKKRFWQKGVKSRAPLVATAPPKPKEKKEPHKSLEELAKELDVKAPPAPEKEETSPVDGLGKMLSQPLATLRASSPESAKDKQSAGQTREAAPPPRVASKWLKDIFAPTKQ